MIETERLILREWREDDLADLVEGLNCFETAKGLTVPFPYTEEDGKSFISKHLKNGNGNYYFSVQFKENGKVIGGTNVSVSEENPQEGGGGIWVNEKYTGIGIGTEIWVARAKFAFEELGLKVLKQGFYEYNERSKHMQLKVGGKIIGEKVGNCPAMGGMVKEILTELTKEDFNNYLNSKK